MAPRTEPGFPFGGRAVWQVLRPPAAAIARLWLHLEPEGPPLPSGPVVVAANHFSHVDGVMVGIAARRPIRFLAVDELFGRSRLFDSFIGRVGAIPVSRTRAPLGALRTALADLAAGETIGVFPEGERVWEWGERPAKRGAAWLARRAGVPFVPVTLIGTDLVMGREATRPRRASVRAVRGAPIHPGDFEREPDPVTAMTAEWVRRVGEAISRA